jgi:hypothetical protein
MKPKEGPGLQEKLENPYEHDTVIEDTNEAGPAATKADEPERKRLITPIGNRNNSRSYAPHHLRLDPSRKQRVSMGSEVIPSTGLRLRA